MTALIHDYQDALAEWGRRVRAVGHGLAALDRKMKLVGGAFCLIAGNHACADFRRDVETAGAPAFGVVGEQLGLPREKSIAVRNNDWNRSAATQIELHPKAFEVADAHRTNAARTAKRCPDSGSLTVPRAWGSVKLSGL